MSYTNTDLANLEAALLALATGNQVVSVTVRDKTIRYSENEIEKLRSLRAEVLTEIQNAAGRRRFVLTSTSKGL